MYTITITNTDSGGNGDYASFQTATLDDKTLCSLFAEVRYALTERKATEAVADMDDVQVRKLLGTMLTEELARSRN